MVELRIFRMGSIAFVDMDVHKAPIAVAVAEVMVTRRKVSRSQPLPNAMSFLPASKLSVRYFDRSTYGLPLAQGLPLAP